MSPLDHIRRFPKARSSTLAHLIEQERVHAKLRAEIAKIQRKRRLERIKRALWPSWVWR